LKQSIKLLGFTSLLISVVSGSSATFIALIGFSEYLALLPIMNLYYTPGLQTFFRGISGLNFSMLSMGTYVACLPFTKSAKEKEARFSNAGFDSQSFMIGSADYFFTVLLTVVSMFGYKALNKLLGKKKEEKIYLT